MNDYNINPGKLSCIIVDDEVKACHGLSRMLSKIPEVRLIEAFSSSARALEWLAHNTVDLAFLDIRMPEDSGLEIARRLPKSTQVIFITAFTEYAVDSYNVDATYYLLKPVNLVRLRQAINKALSLATYVRACHAEESPAGLESVPPDSNHFFLHLPKEGLVKINFDDIVTVEAMRDYVIFNLADGRRKVARITMKRAESLLPPSPRFLRVNRSSIVNSGAIFAATGKRVTMKDGSFYPIGETYRSPLIEALLRIN